MEPQKILKSQSYLKKEQTTRKIHCLTEPCLQFGCFTRFFSNIGLPLWLTGKECLRKHKCHYTNILTKQYH